MNPAERPLKRSERKADTRRRILAAATTLFRNYDFNDVTIRQIADIVGMSVGTVMGAVGNKADLFNEVLIADHATTAAAISSAIAGHENDPTFERVWIATRAAVTQQFGNAHLLRASFISAWQRSPEAVERNRVGLNKPFEALVSILKDGQERGEVDRDLDLSVAVEMIFAMFTVLARYAIFAGMNLPNLLEHLNHQLRVLFDGFATRTP